MMEALLYYKHLWDFGSGELKKNYKMILYVYSEDWD